MKADGRLEPDWEYHPPDIPGAVIPAGMAEDAMKIIGTRIDADAPTSAPAASATDQGRFDALNEEAREHTERHALRGDEARPTPLQRRANGTATPRAEHRAMHSPLHQGITAGNRLTAVATDAARNASAQARIRFRAAAGQRARVRFTVAAPTARP
jgi:hypothetical protein